MEKPILFNTEMVRVILDGRKTSTRRPIKPQPQKSVEPGPVNAKPFAVWVDYSKWIKPQYQVGDILWVRETWAEVTSLSDPYHCGGNALAAGVNSWIYYKADNKKLPEGFKWCPSIHMPRKAARLFLRVTNIRVERLWDITENDAIAEGFNMGDKASETSTPALTAKQSFMWTWQRLYDKGDYPWASNPWVWVYEFTKI